MKDSTYIKMVVEDELKQIKLRLKSTTDLEEIKALKSFKRRIKESMKEVVSS